MSEQNRMQLLHSLLVSYTDLKRLLIRKFGCALLAEDIVQDAWIKLQKPLSGEGVNQPGDSALQSASTAVLKNPRAYLFKMVVNLAIDRLRLESSRGRYISEESVSEDIPAEQALPDKVLDYQQRIAILQAAVEELPPRCREVFILHKFSGLSHKDIASRLGISRNMVEKHMIRGLAHCRDRLEQAIKYDR